MKTTLFRPQATEHQSGADARGGLLRVLPPWTIGLYLSLVALLAVAFAAAAVGRVDEVVRGHGRIVWSRQPVPIAAPTAVIVGAVEVTPGARVVAGQPLLRVRTLADLVLDHPPADRSSGPDQGGIAAPTSGSPTEHVLVAPIDGVVELAVGPGDYLPAGAYLATVIPDDAELIACLELAPAARRRAQPGTPVRLGLDAFPAADFGTLDGRLTDSPCSPDDPNAASSGTAPGAGTSGPYPSPQGAAWPPDSLRLAVTLATPPPELRIAAGQALAAELVLGRRSVLALLFAPLGRQE